MNARRRFLLATGKALLGAALLRPAIAAPRRRIGGVLPLGIKPGTLCIVTPGDDVAPGISAGDVVRFARAPIPACSGAIFLYAPGEYVYSHSDDKWVGRDNAHYAAILDRRRLRLLLSYES